MTLIIQIIKLFDQRDKTKLFLVLLLMISSGFLEMVGIGLIFPFMNLIISPELTETNIILNYLYELLSFSTHTSFIIFMGFLLVFVNIIKNLYTLISVYVQQNFLIRKRIDFAKKMFLGFMQKPFEFHLNNNSAMLLRDFNAVDHVFQSLLIPFFGLLTELIVISFLLGFLFYTNTYIT